MRLIKNAIDTASRQTLLGNSLVVVAPKASEQKDFTIDSKSQLDFAAEWRSPRGW